MRYNHKPKLDPEMKPIIDGLKTLMSFTGLLFQIQGAKPTKKLWEDTKQSTITYIEEHGGFPATFEMPCDNELHFESSKEIMDLPIKDIPCPCGVKTHWLIRFISFDID